MLDPLRGTSSDSSVSHSKRAFHFRDWHRVAILGAVLIAAMALTYLLPIRGWLTNSEPLRRTLTSLGIWTCPACILITAILVGCGVPRLLLCGLGGMVLGFAWGLMVAQTGTLAGYYAIFLFARWGGRQWALGRWPSLRKWADLIHDRGLMGVILLRQLPVHGNAVNLGLGLSHVKHRHFLIGTAIGSLPEAIPTTLAGAGLAMGSLKASAGYLTLAMVGLTIVWLGCGYLFAAMRHSRPGSEILAEAAGLEDAGDEPDPMDSTSRGDRD